MSGKAPEVVVSRARHGLGAVGLKVRLDGEEGELSREGWCYFGRDYPELTLEQKADLVAEEARYLFLTLHGVPRESIAMPLLRAQEASEKAAAEVAP